jgi:hypothetical protein
MSGVSAAGCAAGATRAFTGHAVLTSCGGSIRDAGISCSAAASSKRREAGYLPLTLHDRSLPGFPGTLDGAIPQAGKPWIHARFSPKLQEKPGSVRSMR